MTPDQLRALAKLIRGRGYAAPDMGQDPGTYVVALAFQELTDGLDALAADIESTPAVSTVLVDDPEVNAMRIMVATLGTLPDDETRRRVLRWLTRRHDDQVGPS